MDQESVSYWQQASPDFPLSSDVPPSVEVAIIGGGLLGAATSYWLARAGVHAALLERTALAAGATGRNGGFVRAGPAGSYSEAVTRLGQETARHVMRLTMESQAVMRQILEEEDISCEYREPGTLRLATTSMQEEQIRREIAILQADGFTAIWLDRPQVQAQLPIPLGPDIRGARFRPKQGLVHSARLVHGLATAALRHSALAYQADVYDLEQEGGQICLHTSRGTLVAQAVVVAINACKPRHEWFTNPGSDADR
jgi:gamma-glutamylputrescine oxidase